ncbi:MAG: hydrogenase maturation nickel metallochaperone HypA [Bacteroidota bacterium]
MHELSIVQSIFSTLESELSEPEMQTVSVVELKIGLLANVEPILLQNAFTAFQETHPHYSSISLQTEMVEIRIHCPACDTDSIVENYVFQCSQCGAPSNRILSGEELLIHRIHYEGVP